MQKRGYTENYFKTSDDVELYYKLWKAEAIWFIQTSLGIRN